jgi:2-C-methyl-D-erythritol 4-phosphate cytidylyltransferase
MTASMTGNSAHESPRYWAVVPAAGVGARMASDRPKQYLPLGGQTIIEHTLMRLAADPAIAGIVVALAADDGYWDADFDAALRQRLPAALATVTGGAERCHSVLQALTGLLSGGLAFRGAEHDWVLVHDAARPCIPAQDIRRLIDTLADDPVGGLLGIPVADTMKRVDEGRRVVETVCRQQLWRALTPQMFRLGPLLQALETVMAQGVTVTDDAGAMELAGFAPRMVSGDEQNIKITRPRDLALAAMYLQLQEGSQ